jgi:hypothetical protein
MLVRKALTAIGAVVEGADYLEIPRRITIFLGPDRRFDWNPVADLPIVFL